MAARWWRVVGEFEGDLGEWERFTQILDSALSLGWVGGLAGPLRYLFTISPPL